MKILAYHHATMFARDLDKSVRFFRDTLGMTLMPHEEFTQENVRFFQASERFADTRSTGGRRERAPSRRDGGRQP